MFSQNTQRTPGRLFPGFFFCAIKILHIVDNKNKKGANDYVLHDLSKTAQKTPPDGVTTFLVKQSGGEECASGYTGLSQRSFTSASASYIFSSASLAFLFPAP